ncbi:MAG: hypothetical protein U0992_13510 [Planctomycetaceae bacterium]
MLLEEVVADDGIDVIPVISESGVAQADGAHDHIGERARFGQIAQHGWSVAL